MVARKSSPAKRSAVSRRGGATRAKSSSRTSVRVSARGTSQSNRRNIGHTARSGTRILSRTSSARRSVVGPKTVRASSSRSTTRQSLNFGGRSRQGQQAAQTRLSRQEAGRLGAQARWGKSSSTTKRVGTHQTHSRRVTAGRKGAEARWEREHSNARIAHRGRGAESRWESNYENRGIRRWGSGSDESPFGRNSRHAAPRGAGKSTRRATSKYNSGNGRGADRSRARFR